MYGAMWWIRVVPSLLAVCTQAFAPTPIQLGGVLARNYVLAPKAILKGSVPSREVPQFLTINAQAAGVSASMNPVFMLQPDGTITWGDTPLCVEASGKNIIVNHCIGGPTQLWSLRPSGHGQMKQVQLKSTNKCIDVNEKLKGDGFNGAPVELRDCNDGNAKSWIFEESAAPIRSYFNFVRHGAISCAAMAVLSALILGTWFRRKPTPPHALALAQSGPPLLTNQGGMCLSTGSTCLPPRLDSICLAPLNISVPEKTFVPGNIDIDDALDALDGLVAGNLEPALSYVQGRKKEVDQTTVQNEEHNMKLIGNAALATAPPLNISVPEITYVPGDIDISDALDALDALVAGNIEPALSYVQLDRKKEVDQTTVQNEEYKMKLIGNAALATVQQNGLALQDVLEEEKNNHEVVLAAVQQNGLALQHASDEMRNNREIVLAAVQQDGRALEFAADMLRDDSEVLLVALQQNADVLNFAGEALKNNVLLELFAEEQNLGLESDLEVALVAVKNNAFNLKSLGEASKNYFGVVLAAVQQNGLALYYASELMRQNRKIVLAAVQQDGRALQLAADRLRNDSEILCEAKQQNADVLNLSEEALKNEVLLELWKAEKSCGLDSDPEVALVAVQKNSDNLKFVRKKMKNYYEVALAAVQRSGSALQHAKKELRKHRELVLAAVQQDGRALQFAAARLQTDFEVVLAAVQQNGDALQFAGEALRNHVDIVSAAVKQDGNALVHAGPAPKDDPQVVLEAVQNEGCALQYAGDGPKNAEHVVRAAVAQSPLALRFAGGALRNDNRTVIAACRKDWDAFQYAGREMVLAAIQKDGRALHFAAAALQNDSEVVLAAVQQNGLALKFAGEALQNDTQIVIAAVKQHGDALQFASAGLKDNESVVQVAMRRCPLALRFAGAKMKNDEGIVFDAIRRDWNAFQYAGKMLQIRWYELSKMDSIHVESYDWWVWEQLVNEFSDLMQNRPVVVGPFTFSSIAALRQAVRQIKKGYRDEEFLMEGSSDFALMVAVLGHHPNRDQKEGAGIVGLKVAQSVHNSVHESARCFYVIRADETEEDFSAIKCIDALAARMTTEEDFIYYRKTSAP